jgi:transporter family protein
LIDSYFPRIHEGGENHSDSKSCITNQSEYRGSARYTATCVQFPAGACESHTCEREKKDQTDKEYRKISHNGVTIALSARDTVVMLIVAGWFWYAVAAAILYGAHQIFTKLAADRIGEGLGGFVVEATAALSILVYLAFLWLASRWNQQSSAQGIFYSVLTGTCVGAGTIAFFLLFQKGGPLSAVPVILAVGAAIMAVAGILFFREPASWSRLTGIALAIIGLLLLRR